MINSRSGYLRAQLYQDEQASNPNNSQNFNHHHIARQGSVRKMQNIIVERSEKPKRAIKKISIYINRLLQKNLYWSLLQLIRSKKPVVLYKALRCTQQRMMTPTKSPPQSTTRNRRYSSGIKASSQQQQTNQQQKNLLAQNSLMFRDEYVKSLVLIIKKSNLVKKMYGFVWLKKNLEIAKQYDLNKLKFLDIIKQIFKNHGKRLKKELFYKLISASHSDLNTRKAHLQKMNIQTRKKCKLLLPKVTKLFLGKKLQQYFTIILKFANNTQQFTNFNDFICRLETINLKKYKFWAFKMLKKKLINFYNMKKIVSMGYFPLKSIYLTKMKQGITSLKNYSCKKKLQLQKTIRLKLIIQKIVIKYETSVFERLKSHYGKDIPLFLNLSEIKEKNHKNLEELVVEYDDQNQINYKEVLQTNQKLLKKTQLENTQLLQRLYQNEQLLKKYKKQIRLSNDKLKQLQRELRDKQLIIKNLLSQQNKNIQYINKIRQESNKTKNAQCQCKNRIELTEINQIQCKLSEMLQSVIQNVENQQNYGQNYYYNNFEYRMFNNLLQIFKDLVSTLEKDTLFKKEYIFLNPIKSTLRQIEELNQKLTKKIECGLQIQEYFFRKRTLCFMKDYKNEQMLRLTNNLFEKIREQNETENTFKLIKVKLNEYCRNTDIVSRQFHKSLQKNMVMKNTLIKLEFNQNEIRNYMRALSHKSNKLTESISKSKEKDDEMLKILFLDFLESSINFNKKMLLKQKIADKLNLTQHELEYIGIVSASDTI